MVGDGLFSAIRSVPPLAARGRYRSSGRVLWPCDRGWSLQPEVCARRQAAAEAGYRMICEAPVQLDGRFVRSVSDRSYCGYNFAQQICRISYAAVRASING